MKNHSRPNRTYPLCTRSGTCNVAAALLTLSMFFPSAAIAADSAAAVLTTDWKKVANYTTCEAMNPQHCVGMYGFAINEHGHFIVGPNLDGKTQEGELTAAEFARLKAHADAIKVNVAKDPCGKCISGHHIMGVTDVITMTIGVKVYSITDQLNVQCSYHGDSESTQQMVEDMHQLRKKYYVTPF